MERLRTLDPGESAVAELAASITDELTDRELLGLLDGDVTLLTGLRQIAKFGYNRRPIIAGELERLGLPGIRFTDGPRGIVMGRSTCFPVAIARGATWNRELERDIGRAIGLEGRAQGANVFAGVCINLLRHPAWGRSQETYGDDPIHLGAMGSALTVGVREQLMACVKHFALNSIENARFRVDVEVADDVLHEVFLPHFRDVVDCGVDAVMTAYNSVNGQWCGDSDVLLADILRREWGFDGFVMSDFLFGHRDPVGSVSAGLDVEMPFVQQRAAALPDALADGDFKRSDAVAAARRLIAAQLRWAASVPEQAPDEAVVASDDHRRLARRAAAQSMVLLENRTIDGRAVLPVDVGSVERVAVLGALAAARNLGDGGSSAVRPPDVVCILDGLQAVFGPDRIVSLDDGKGKGKGKRRGRSKDADRDNGEDLGAAVALARTSDVAVVVVGYTHADEGEAVLAMDRGTMELLPGPFGSRRMAGAAAKTMALLGKFRAGEGGDRTSLRLSSADEALIEEVSAVNPRTVVVLIAGGAVITESWRSAPGAILHAWYPGMEGGRAVADVLTGASEPTGRLPFAVPTDAAHLPHFDPDATSIEYDRWWGQRRFDRDGRDAAYPLGFGLGYTTIAADAVSVLTTDVGDLSGRAEVTVTNTGERDGSTVIQLYAVGDAGPRRPTRQLVGFERVTVEAGATVTIVVGFSLRPIARRERAGTWVVVDASYRIEAAQFSGDPLAASARLEI